MPRNEMRTVLVGLIWHALYPKGICLTDPSSAKLLQNNDIILLARSVLQASRVSAAAEPRGSDKNMHSMLFVDRRSYDDAAALIEAFGTMAGEEAELRADQSRELGNYIKFCHWRQIGRVLPLLLGDQAMGTLH